MSKTVIFDIVSLVIILAGVLAFILTGLPK